MSGMFTSIPASDKDVEFFAKHLTDAYIHCRTWGHDAEPHSIKVGPRGVYWDAKLRCAHGCGVKWVVLVAADGEMLKRTLSYDDAPDYLSPVGRIDKNGKQIIRRQFMTRATRGKRKPVKPAPKVITLKPEDNDERKR